MSSKRTTSSLGVALLITIALTLLAPTSAICGDWTGNVNFFLGQKNLKENDWEPLEEQPEFGAEISWGKVDWPVLFATDLLASSDDDTVFDPFFFGNVDIEGSTSELGLGVRKIWEKGSSRPYLGAGLALVKGEIEFRVSGVRIHEDDNAVGPWVGGGVFWRLGSRFNIGLSVRYSNAEVSIQDFDLEAGGWHGGLLLGWGWPATQ